MSKFISALITAGLLLGFNAAIAQNVDKDEIIAGHRAYNDAGDRQVGLEQFLAEEQQCSGLSADARGDCMHMAKVRYQGWAIMQCELVAGSSRQRCYQNIEANVMGSRNPETGQAIRSGGDEDKPGRQ
jgi:hypothetical protein